MRNSVGLFLFLAAVLCLAQRSAPPPTPAAHTTFHSDIMNFDFVYPSSFTTPKSKTGDAPTKEEDKGSRAEKADASCVSVPVAVMDMHTDFNMIFLKRYDLACLNKEITTVHLGETAASFLVDSLGHFGEPVISSSTDYDITSRSASAVFGSVNVPHASGKHVIYGAAGCIISGKNIACFEFLSNDCPTLAILSASTVKFTDSATTPIIPAKLIPACNQ